MVKHNHPLEVEQHELVAVTSDRVTGLYREGEDYFLVDVTTEEGNVTVGEPRREELGQYGYPPSPGGRWTWLPGKQPWATSSSAPLPEITVSVPPRSTPQLSKTDGPSAVTICMDCKESVLNVADHYHTTRDASGFCGTICCPCVEKRGIACPVAA